MHLSHAYGQVHSDPTSCACNTHVRCSALLILVAWDTRGVCKTQMCMCRLYVACMVCMDGTHGAGEHGLHTCACFHGVGAVARLVVRVCMVPCCRCLCYRRAQPHGAHVHSALVQVCVAPWCMQVQVCIVLWCRCVQRHGACRSRCA